MASPTIADAKDQTESGVAMGYTMTEICDKFIGFFLHKKPETKDWRKVLLFRKEWERYREHFYIRCQVRIDMETDSSMKQKLVVLARKVKVGSLFPLFILCHVYFIFIILNCFVMNNISIFRYLDYNCHCRLCAL
jgi:hypothetical protein